MYSCSSRRDHLRCLLLHVCNFYSSCLLTLYIFSLSKLLLWEGKRAYLGFLFFIWVFMNEFSRLISNFACFENIKPHFVVNGVDEVPLPLGEKPPRSRHQVIRARPFRLNFFLLWEYEGFVCSSRIHSFQTSTSILFGIHSVNMMYILFFKRSISFETKRWFCIAKMCARQQLDSKKLFFHKKISSSPNRL